MSINLFNNILTVKKNADQTSAFKQSPSGMLLPFWGLLLRETLVIAPFFKGKKLRLAGMFVVIFAVVRFFVIHENCKML